MAIVNKEKVNAKQKRFKNFFSVEDRNKNFKKIPWLT